MCPVCCKNKLSTSFQVWVHICLLGGSVLPPEHILTPRIASHPLSVAATFFPAWLSIPSWHRKHLCIRTGIKAVPLNFLLPS